MNEQQEREMFEALEVQAKMLGKYREALKANGFTPKETIQLLSNFQDNLLNGSERTLEAKAEQERRKKAEAEQLNSILAKLTGGFVNPFEN